MASKILDPFGYPVSSGGGGRLLDASRQDSTRRPSWETRLEAIHKGVNYQDWRTVLSASRRLCYNFPILETAIATKAIHAVGRGWSPAFLGENQAWGDGAKAWLCDEWFAICDVEGDGFDWKTSLYLDSIAVDTDGDFAVCFTQTGKGYPKLQHLAADRIGQRNWSSRIVGAEDAWTTQDDGNGNYSKRKGVYEGFRIELGIIRDEYGTPVAARVLGGVQAEDQDVSLNDMQFKFDPRARGQLRGLPAAAGSIEFLAMAFETHDAESRALMASSFVSFLEYNESGAGDPSDAANSGVADTEVKRETWEKGQVRYYRSNSGGKLEAFQSDRPGEQWEAYQDRIVRLALGPIWPYSLAWKPDGMNGTQERSAIEQARGLVKDRQDLLFPVARRQVGWAVSKAIKLGILPPYTGKDAGKGGQLKWGFEMPPEFNIDHGREDKQWLDLNLRGAANLTSLLAREGQGTLKTHLDVRENETDAILERAKRTSEKHGIPLEAALTFYRQTNPNPPASAPAEQPPEDPAQPPTQAR